MRPFGDAEVGAGGTPAIWDGSLTGIQVAKKIKYYLPEP